MSKKHSALYVCNTCNFEEDIPNDVLEFFDVVDPDFKGAPPTFQCQQCIGIMLPADFNSL
jgi:hypothetical protein